MLGTTAGALVALLYAPASGKALRATIQAKPYIDLQRLHAERQARMAQTQDPFGQRQAILKQPLHRTGWGG